MVKIRIFFMKKFEKLFLRHKIIEIRIWIQPFFKYTDPQHCSKVNLIEFFCLCLFSFLFLNPILYFFSVFQIFSFPCQKIRCFFRRTSWGHRGWSSAPPPGTASPLFVLIFNSFFSEFWIRIRIRSAFLLSLDLDPNAFLII